LKNDDFPLHIWRWKFRNLFISTHTQTITASANENK